MHVSTTTAGRDNELQRDAAAPLLPPGRDGQKETLANLHTSRWEAIDAIRAVLAGKTVMSVDQASRSSAPSRPGTSPAALTMARRLGLGKLLDRSPAGAGSVPGDDRRAGDRPGSKLGMVRTLASPPSRRSWASRAPNEDDLYAAMDWLLERQDRIEDRLAARHLRDV